MKKPHLLQPDQELNTLPPGIPYIIANEAAERFSYYGMRAILVVFMTQYLSDSSGNLAVMSEQEAQGYFHLFASSVYFTPVLGALLSDGMWGKYKTIILLSLVYCLGHLALSFDSTKTGLLIGQCLIAIGAGGIKPCVSAHVGDQFGKSNRHLLGKVYSVFYFAINLGAFWAMLIIPWLLAHRGPALAFAVPGILMLLATWVFWLGRHRFVHVPAAGMQFVKEALGRHGLSTLKKLAPVYLFVAIFWSLFEQIGSSWIIQAQKMDRILLGVELLPSQIQAANPLLILLLTPIFSMIIYPALNRYFKLTDIKKMTIGFTLTVAAFAIAACVQTAIDKGTVPTIGWQLLAYLILTSAEVMVSVTCLEFSYRHAPKTMKSTVMALYFLSVALGNLFTSSVNFLIMNADGTSKLEGAEYFWFFTILMLSAASLFYPVNSHFDRNDYNDARS